MQYVARYAYAVRQDVQRLVRAYGAQDIDAVTLLNLGMNVFVWLRVRPSALLVAPKSKSNTGREGQGLHDEYYGQANKETA